MKKILLLSVLLITLTTFSQNGYTIIIDGKEVFVKDDGSTTRTIPTVASPNEMVKSGVHIVKKGENLYSISRLYNLTVDELCKMNNINEDYRLGIDQSLKIVSFSKPSSNFSSASFYIVKKEDTLYNISKRYGLTVHALKKLNDLDSNRIAIGQRLKLN